MKILELDLGGVESNVVLRDDVEKTVMIKHFYGYNTHIKDILEFAYEVAYKYGVDEIWINEDSTGAIAYDYLVKKRHTTDGFALYKYRTKRLTTKVAGWD